MIRIQHRSEAQIEASRANGALSRGPITPEGKAISCLNNTRHDLLSNTILIPGESPEEFLRMLASFTAEFEPQTESELTMVEELLVAKWRQMRIWAMSAAAQKRDIAARAENNPELRSQSFGAQAWDALENMVKNPDRVHRYEAFYARRHSRLANELKALKKAREKERDESSKM